MPGATPVYALPYPIATDRLDDAVTTIPHNLALQLESTLQGWGGIAAPGAWVNVNPTSGVDAGPPFPHLAYRKIGNLCRWRGRWSVVGGVPAGLTIYTIPVGFRPTGTITKVVASYPSGAIPLDIKADGSIVVQMAIAAGSSSFFSMDDVDYPLD